MKESKMDAMNFCYFLRGFLEITSPQNITEQQIKIINDHLDLVLNKVTPNRIVTKNNSPLIDPAFWPNINPPIKYCNKLSDETLNHLNIPVGS